MLNNARGLGFRHYFVRSLEHQDRQRRLRRHPTTTTYLTLQSDSNAIIVTIWNRRVHAVSFQLFPPYNKDVLRSLVLKLETGVHHH